MTVRRSPPLFKKLSKDALSIKAETFVLKLIGVGVTIGVGSVVSSTVGVGVTISVGSGVGSIVGIGVTVGVGSGVGSTVGVGVTIGVGSWVGSTVGVGVTIGVGSIPGDGCIVWLGSMLGDSDSTTCESPGLIVSVSLTHEDSSNTQINMNRSNIVLLSCFIITSFFYKIKQS